MNPTLPAVSHAAVTRVLDVLEGRSPLPLRVLAEEAEISLSTAARATKALTRAGILRWDGSADPTSGHPCRLVSAAPVALLPILRTSRGFGQVTVFDLTLRPQGTTVMEIDPAYPPEDSLRLLCRRAVTLLRGCNRATGLSVTAPILLTDRPSEADIGTVTDTLGIAPLATVGYGEAIAATLPGQALPEDVASMLHLWVGRDSFACLLTRSGGDGWSVSTLGSSLSATLSRYLPGSRDTESLRRGTAGFLKDLYRFLSPDRVLVEDPRGLIPTPEELRLILPDRADIRCPPCDGDAPSAADLGAAMLGRRLLWDRIMEKAQGR